MCASKHNVRTVIFVITSWSLGSPSSTRTLPRCAQVCEEACDAQGHDIVLLFGGHGVAEGYKDDAKTARERTWAWSLRSTMTGGY